MGAVARKKQQAITRRWLWARRTVQVLFFLLFFYLLLLTVQGVTGRLPFDLFFHLDPLVGISSLISSRSWIAPMLLGLITLVLALVFGRVWCGWICPLGTILDWLPSHRNSKKPGISPVWKQGKYLLLFTVIISAILGSLMFMVLDPITILFRTTSGVILPGLNWFFDGVSYWLYGFEAIRPAVDWVDGALHGWLLANQPFYLVNFVLLVIFGAILGLNAIRSRFWCRYLCPLGGLLGLLSIVSFIRHRVDNEKCVSCNKCATLCPTGAIDPEKQFTADTAECTVCLHCLPDCPTNAISFSRVKRVMKQRDGSRRWFIYSLGVAAVIAAMSRLLPVAARTNDGPVKPPGSSEESLYSQCVRCGECIKVCPTGVIQPLQTGNLIKIWTPGLKTRLGYCDYSCNSCGTICPTGAIPNLSLETKRKTVIGVARIDRTRCITWVEGRDCIVCEEMCPVPEKAVRLGSGGHGSVSGRHPQVIEDLCIGCGICEYQCPVAGESAIRVYSQ